MSLDINISSDGSTQIRCDFTRMTLETREGCYAVSIPHGALPINAIIENLVEPLLLAAGFHPDTVQDALYRNHAREEPHG